MSLLVADHVAPERPDPSASVEHVPADALNGLLHELPPVSLAAVVATADLQVRTDRKYLLAADAAARVLDRYADRVGADQCPVLQIDRLRAFDYESVYFDTPELDSYLRHAQGRRVRFKVRTRSYLQTGGTVLEVKQSGRGQTEKSRLEVDGSERAVISPRGGDFIQEVLGEPIDIEAFAPVITTRYQRSTMLDRADGARVTIDQGLHFLDGDLVRRLPAGQVVVEVKSSGGATDVDRLLWRAGARPLSMSKFAIGLAATRPWLPANRWHRLMRRTGLRAG